jgi:hypothetical protein
MSSADAEAVTPNSNVKRLPTNHRRRKVLPELRKRTARACVAAFQAMTETQLTIDQLQFL